MNVQIVRTGDVWGYNPLSEGYTEDAVFSAVAGTPTISSNKLRLNAASIITYDKVFLNGSMEIQMIIPAVPTTGDDREFGLKDTATSTKGAMLFDVTDDVFTAKVYDASGVLVASKVINWNADWTNEEANYRITWTERDVYFVINNVIVARVEGGFDKDIVSADILSKKALHLYIANANSDNMDISLISFS